MPDTAMAGPPGTPRLSIIIPTLNEADYLPDLLTALAEQTRPPDQVIVADAGSTDGTVELAHARGARVVPGGLPAAGRNAGARAAAGDLLLFLDADVAPPRDFVEHAVAEFERGGYVVATALIAAMTGDALDQFIADATNLYLRVMQPLSPHAPGFCIFVRRAIHEQIGGFDESLKLSEDMEYVRRAARQGEFGILTGTRIRVSMRRVEKEGLVGLALKYAWCEMYALAGKPVRALPFEYEFGKFGPAHPSGARSVIDVGELRRRLGRLASPVQNYSRARLAQFDRWMQLDPRQFTRERLRRLLRTEELYSLNRYLRKRLALAYDEGMREPLRASFTKLKTLPRETIRFLEAEPAPAPPPAGTPPDPDSQGDSDGPLS